ncbi:MAG: hypothetical protein P4L53_20645 [Candidatus Obscuribacterales bacterium]|nr:hypothetical protein [Candidatus Obscuribacterales bacterium]
MIVFLEHRNEFFIELLQQGRYTDIVDAARDLELPLIMLVSLIFSPILTFGDRDLKFIAERFGQNIDDFKRRWLLSNSKNLGLGAAMADIGPYIVIDTSGTQR